MQKSFKNIIIQSFAFMILLFVLNLFLRGIFIIFFSEAIAGVSVSELSLFLYNAFRYDGQIIGVLSVLFFFLSFVPKEKIIKIYAFLVIFVTAFVGIANIGFYDIYQDVFNATLLGLIYDDRKAIFETALNGDYHFSYKILLWLIISFVFYAFFVFLRKKITQIQSKRFTFTLFVIFAFACLFEINGHIGVKGIALSYRITPVTNTFLRKITHGGFRDLLYVYRSYARISHSNFADYTSENPNEVVRKFFKIANNTNVSEGGGGVQPYSVFKKRSF